MGAQAAHLVDHHLAAGVGWGQLYREAWRKGFLAENGSNEERWYAAIASELRMRGTFIFRFFFSFFLVLSPQPFHLPPSHFSSSGSTCHLISRWRKRQLINHYAEVVGAVLAGMP